MIDTAQLRELARRTGSPTVSSVYLDVDGRHRPSRAGAEAAFEPLAAHLRRAANGDMELLEAVQSDAQRMRNWLAHDLDRTATRGVAMFACSNQDWFVA